MRTKFLQCRLSVVFIGILAVALSFSIVPTIRAQYTANFQTNIISGVTNNWSGDYIVGSNTFADALLTQNAGVLLNANGYLGYKVSGSNDSVVITDSHSIWRNAGSLFVGYSGFANSLTISNHGTVVNTNGFVGYNSSSTNNSVLITGASSFWSGMANLYVGYSGSDNSLVINASGTVHSAAGYIGNDTTASGNSILVTGNSSVWGQLASLFIGVSGADNSLVISNGGQIINAHIPFGPSIGPAYVGYNNSSSNNSIVVTGTNSFWRNITSDISVGYSGSRNALTVSSGGQVSNNVGIIGNLPGSAYNIVSVVDPGSAWQMQSELYVGMSGGNNSLIISNGGLVTVASFAIAYIGRNVGSSNNHVLVTDTGSFWQVREELYVGTMEAGNSLAISNGGQVVSMYGIVGNDYASSNSSVLITGSKSVWNILTNLYMGYNGPDNSLVISHGGLAVDLYGYVGFSEGTNNNVLITDSGSVWSNSGALYIGWSAPGNSMVISNGGKAFGEFNGVGANSINNSVLVTGVGSLWETTFELDVGSFGAGSSLIVSDGGRVADQNGKVGTTSVSDNNSILVTGAGSVWSNSQSLYIGDAGNGNSLVISNGGQVISSVCSCSSSYIGNGPSSTNSVIVTDGGVWRNRALYVGHQSSSNSLKIAGGSVTAASLVIGFASVTCDNLLRLDSGSVIVTNSSHNATLEVAGGQLIMNGGTLQVDRLVITNACGLFVHNGGTLIVSNVVLDPNMSAVGDGISNGWKQQYGFDPFDPTVANTDADGDGMSNLQEYLAGTDPTNNASTLHISSITRQGNDLLVTWTMGAGKTNALQATVGDGSAIYSTSNFADIFLVTNTIGSTTNYLDVGGATNFPTRYYRVRLVP